MTWHQFPDWWNANVCRFIQCMYSDSYRFILSLSQRYVTVCNTLAGYCLSASAHSLRSATEEAADWNTL